MGAEATLALGAHIRSYWTLNPKDQGRSVGSRLGIEVPCLRTRSRLAGPSMRKVRPVCPAPFG